jgi:hypothetical protein
MEQSTEILRLKEADLVWRTVEEETVILHRGDWQYLTVNQTGTLLWTRLVDGATRADLVSVLLAEYDIDERRAAADVDAFLDLLSERDLISAAGGAQRP